mgnify:CR=1 FL=1
MLGPAAEARARSLARPEGVELLTSVAGCYGLTYQDRMVYSR